MSRAGRRPTPEGDERRDRTCRVACERLLADGFDAVTHRKVAARADRRPRLDGYDFVRLKWQLATSCATS